MWAIHFPPAPVTSILGCPIPAAETCEALSNKELWSFQILPCPRTEGTRAPATPGSVWLNQLSLALRLKWWGTDRLQTGCCGFWCCLASGGVEMLGCYDTSQGSTASAGWKLTPKPHPQPSKTARGSLVPLQPVASLHGPAYRCGKYSHWLECGWSGKQMWPWKAKKSLVWTVVPWAEAVHVLQVQDWPLEHWNGAWRNLCSLLVGPAVQQNYQVTGWTQKFMAPWK